MVGILSPEWLIDRLLAHPFFADLDPVSLRVIALASERVSAPPNALLFNEGEASDCAYLILEGAVRLTSSDAHDMTAKQGELVHPLGLLADLRRPMTAVTERDCELIKIPRTVFQRILESTPAIAAHLRDRLSRDLVKYTNELRAVSTQAFLKTV